MHPGVAPSPALPPVPTGLRSLPIPAGGPCAPPQPTVPVGGRAGMEADGALDPRVLERELREAVAADEKRDRENDAKLRAMRQRVPSYEEFRSVGGRLGQGGGFGCFPTPKAFVNTKALLGARCSCHRADPPSWVSFGARSFGAPNLGPLKRQGHPASFELKPCSERGLSRLSVLSAPGGHKCGLTGQQTQLWDSQKDDGPVAQSPGGTETQPCLRFAPQKSSG